MKKRTKSRIALAASAVFLLSAAAMFAFLLYCRQAAHTPPSPNTTPESTVEDDDGFPAVDWDYWQDINPDVIGWVTIPGTTVDSPILQAHGDVPGYYLKHDVYGNYNPAGAIYLDADCEELGLSSRNAVILGHHFWNDKKVAPMGTVADYKDENFAREHARVLIQTPTAKMTYEARFAQIVNGRERNSASTSRVRRTSVHGMANRVRTPPWCSMPRRSRNRSSRSSPALTTSGSITNAPSLSRVCRKQPRIKPKIRKSRQTHPETVPGGLPCCRGLDSTPSSQDPAETILWGRFFFNHRKSASGGPPRTLI